MPAPNIPEVAVLTMGPWGGVQYGDPSAIDEGKATLAVSVESNLSYNALTAVKSPNYLFAINGNLTPRKVITRVVASVTPPSVTPNYSEQFYLIGYNNTGTSPVGSVPGTLGALAVYRVDRNNIPVSSMSQCEINGSLSFLYGPNTGIGNFDVPAEEFSDQIFFSVPDTGGSSLGPGYRIDASGEVWTWMPQPPASVPTYTATGAGALTGDYQYLYTYTGSGFETSPSPTANPVTLVVTNQEITVNCGGGPADPTVTGINIYRFSELSADDNFVLVGSISGVVPSGGPYMYVDNTPDSAVTGATLILHQDPPPGFVAIKAWKNRIFGLTSAPTGVFVTVRGAQLFYSADANGRAFDTTNGIIDVGLDQNSDLGVALAVVNDALLVFKQYSVLVIAGDSPADFIPEPLFPDIGAFNAKCVVESEQGVFWLAADGQIYYFGTSLQIVSGDIQDYLYNNFANFNNSTAMFFKDNVLCFYPGFGTQSFAYNVKRQQWYTGYAPFTTPFSKRNKCYGALMFGTPSLYELPGSSMPGTPALVQYRSREAYSPTDANEKQFTKCVVTGMLSGFTLLFEVDPPTLGETAGSSFTWTPPGTGGSTSTVVINFPRNMIGKRMRVTITGVVSGGLNLPVYIRRITVFAQPDRVLTPAG